MKQDNDPQKLLDRKALDYRAFLMRCWREGNRWRFTVESIGQDRKQHGFISLEMMITFLREHLASEDENA
ncbi:MAG: hypothetical protein GY805_21900 [Chloroflexi bacterium]|nr:hypothetical protein [Chloroflexota bacterium]